MSELIYSPTDGETRLVNKDERESLTMLRTSDPYSALSRGLAEYLGSVWYKDWNGQPLVAKRVYNASPSLGDGFVAPAIAVTLPKTRVAYGDEMLSGHVRPVKVGEGGILNIGLSYQMPLLVQIYACHPEELWGMVALVHDALSPRLDMSFGPILELPHYHSCFVNYSLAAFAGFFKDVVAGIHRVDLAMTAEARLIRPFPASAAPPATLHLTVETTQPGPPGERSRGNDFMLKALNPPGDL